MNASTAGPHQTYNSWRARSWFEHAKQAKVGGQSAGPKACLAFLVERKQQRMLPGRRKGRHSKRFVPLRRSPYSTADDAAGHPHGAARRRPRPVKVDTGGPGFAVDTSGTKSSREGL
jgi:hypothetical protein